MYAIENGELIAYPDELYHYGILGMKWGVRRYQNQNGNYTSAGKSRYGIGDGKGYTGVKKSGGKSGGSVTMKKRKGLTDKQKTAIKVGAAVAGTALAAYGAKRLMNRAAQKKIAAAAKSYSFNKAKKEAARATAKNVAANMSFSNAKKAAQKASAKNAAKAMTFNDYYKAAPKYNVKTAAANSSFKDAKKAAEKYIRPDNFRAKGTTGAVKNLTDASAKGLKRDVNNVRSAVRTNSTVGALKNLAKTSKKAKATKATKAASSSLPAVRKSSVATTTRKASSNNSRVVADVPYREVTRNASKINLQFGGSAKAVSNQKLKSQQEAINNAAKKRAANASRADAGADYVQQMLKRNKKKLKR